MQKYIITILMLIIPLLVFSEDKDEQTSPSGKKKVKAKSVLSLYDNRVKIKSIDFNKVMDMNGRGENLNVQMIVENQTDDPMELYVFVIALYDKEEITKSSFQKPIREKDRIRSFVPFPLDMKNFTIEQPKKSSNGTIMRDSSGKEIMIKTLSMEPNDIALGVDPETKEPYYLPSIVKNPILDQNDPRFEKDEAKRRLKMRNVNNTDNLVIRTNHLSNYRKNYFFFNHALVLIYQKSDDEKNKNPLIYRKMYEFTSLRKR